MSRPRMSVILVTIRRFEPFVQTVSDLLQQDYPDFEIVVVDQNVEWPSELADTLARIRSDSRVRWLTLSSRGPVLALNRGVAASSGEILLFVDDDVRIPDRGLLGHHADRLADASIGAVVGRERQPGDRIDETAGESSAAPGDVAPSSQTALSPLQQAMWFDRNSSTAQQVITFCTCNGSIRRSTFLAVGGFDEQFAGHAYGYDYDLALRLNATRIRIVYEPRAWLIHCHAPIGGLRLTDPSARVDAVTTARGLWLFVLRHGHRGMYWNLVLTHVLRKTVLLKRNVMRPWRQPLLLVQTFIGLPLAWVNVARGPKSLFLSPDVS